MGPDGAALGRAEVGLRVEESMRLILRPWFYIFRQSGLGNKFGTTTVVNTN